MKTAIISDQHFSFKRNSQLFHDYFLKFYNEIFFPTLEKENIKTVIDMGDTFDNRKGIDFAALTWAKQNYYDRLKKLGCTVLTIVGNHTAYFKSTNQINSVDLLLKEYDNVEVFSETQEVRIGDLDVLFIPWINSENQESSLKKIQNTKAKVAMGHLELQGFRVNSAITMDHGMSSDIFSKFKKVFSGHYHTRSDNGTVYYLGNPYEMFWSDLKDTRGFHIFDTETLEHIPVNNPFRMFYQIYYEDSDHQMFDTRQYEDKIVKVIVKKKSDQKKFDKFLDKLYASNVAELKVIENFDLIEGENFQAFESEDTVSILNRYVEEAEIQLDKNRVQLLLQEIYQEACQLI
jgi:hypothetical protein